MLCQEECKLQKFKIMISMIPIYRHKKNLKGWLDLVLKLLEKQSLDDDFTKWLNSNIVNELDLVYFNLVEVAIEAKQKEILFSTAETAQQMIEKNEKSIISTNKINDLEKEEILEKRKSMQFHLYFMMGKYFWEQGEMFESLKNYKRAWKKSQSVFGKIHPITVQYCQKYQEFKKRAEFQLNIQQNIEFPQFKKDINSIPQKKRIQNLNIQIQMDQYALDAQDRDAFISIQKDSDALGPSFEKQDTLNEDSLQGDIEQLNKRQVFRMGSQTAQSLQSLNNKDSPHPYFTAVKSSTSSGLTSPQQQHTSPGLTPTAHHQRIQSSTPSSSVTQDRIVTKGRINYFSKNRQNEELMAKSNETSVIQSQVGINKSGIVGIAQQAQSSQIDRMTLIKENVGLLDKDHLKYLTLKEKVEMATKIGMENYLEIEKSKKNKTTIGKLIDKEIQKLQEESLVKMDTFHEFDQQSNQLSTFHDLDQIVSLQNIPKSFIDSKTSFEPTSIVLMSKMKFNSSIGMIQRPQTAKSSTSIQESNKMKTEQNFQIKQLPTEKNILHKQNSGSKLQLKMNKQSTKTVLQQVVDVDSFEDIKEKQGDFLVRKTGNFMKNQVKEIQTEKEFPKIFVIEASSIEHLSKDDDEVESNLSLQIQDEQKYRDFMHSRRRIKGKNDQNSFVSEKQNDYSYQEQILNSNTLGKINASQQSYARNGDRRKSQLSDINQNTKQLLRFSSLEGIGDQIQRQMSATFENNEQGGEQHSMDNLKQSITEEQAKAGLFIFQFIRNNIGQIRKRRELIRQKQQQKEQLLKKRIKDILLKKQKSNSTIERSHIEDIVKQFHDEYSQTSSDNISSNSSFSSQNSESEEQQSGTLNEETQQIFNEVSIMSKNLAKMQSVARSTLLVNERASIPRGSVIQNPMKARNSKIFGANFLDLSSISKYKDYSQKLPQNTLNIFNYIQYVYPYNNIQTRLTIVNIQYQLEFLSPINIATLRLHVDAQNFGRGVIVQQIEIVKENLETVFKKIFDKDVNLAFIILINEFFDIFFKIDQNLDIAKTQFDQVDESIEEKGQQQKIVNESNTEKQKISNKQRMTKDCLIVFPLCKGSLPIYKQNPLIFLELVNNVEFVIQNLIFVQNKMNGTVIQMRGLRPQINLLPWRIQIMERRNQLRKLATQIFQVKLINQRQKFKRDNLVLYRCFNWRLKMEVSQSYQEVSLDYSQQNQVMETSILNKLNDSQNQTPRSKIGNITPFQDLKDEQDSDKYKITPQSNLQSDHILNESQTIEQSEDLKQQINKIFKSIIEIQEGNTSQLPFKDRFFDFQPYQFPEVARDIQINPFDSNSLEYKKQQKIYNLFFKQLFISFEFRCLN